MALVLADGIISRDSDILHFAPEECVAKLLRPFAKNYTTADLYRDDVELQLNIEAIDLPSQSFDVIMCSHVLNEVDDKKALVELRRILRPDGRLILTIPIIEGILTYENDITHPDDRERNFYHREYLRIYGADFRDRLGDAGFSYEERTASGRVAIENALSMGDKIFICRRLEREA